MNSEDKTVPSKAERKLFEQCIQSHLNMIEFHRKAIKDLEYKMSDDSNTSIGALDPGTKDIK